MIPIMLPTMFFNRSGAPATVAYIGTNNTGSSASSYTYTAQGIGTASSDRYVVVGVNAPGSGAKTISGVTIGGVSATSIVTEPGASTTRLGFFGLLVTSGTTADIIVSLSGAAATCAIVVYNLKKLQSTTATATAVANSGNPITGTLSSVSAGGVALALVGSNYTNASAVTWSGLTLDVTSTSNGAPYSSASAAFAAAQTNLACAATMPGTPSDFAIIAASFR